MLKVQGRTGDGRPLLMLGLSGENMRRLMADEPISIDLRNFGMGTGQLVIIARTEQDILAQVQAQAGDRMVEDPTLGRGPGQGAP